MKETVQSVDRALSILEILSNYESGLGLSDISSQIELHKSTVHRLLGTLIIKGYVEQDDDTMKYKTTMKLFELGYKKIDKLNVMSLAKPYLQQLGYKTNEVVHLVIREGLEIIYIDKVEGNNTIRMHSRIGMRSPLYCTAVGKVMLAYESEENLHNIWDKSYVESYTPYTITDLTKMKKELTRIKVQNYAIDDEENELGVRCIGAPIFDYQGNVCAAVSISGPIARMTESTLERFSEEILNVTSLISKALGFQSKTTKDKE